MHFYQAGGQPKLMPIVTLLRVTCLSPALLQVESFQIKASQIQQLK